MNLRRDLAEKEQKIRQLETEVAEFRAKLPPPLSPEEQEHQRQAERDRVLFGKAKELRTKVLRHEDSTSRQQAFAEVKALVQSGNPDDLLLGLTTLLHLDGLEFDAESLKPQILGGLSHEEPEIRHAALNCVAMVCADEDALDIALSMANDPSAQVRASAAFHLGWFTSGEPKEEVEALLVSLLWDNEEAVKKRALQGLSRVHSFYPPAEQAERMEALAAELCVDPRVASDVLGLWEKRGEFSPEDAQRCGYIQFEEYLQTWGRENITVRAYMLLLGPQLCSNEGPILSRLCLRLLKDSTNDQLRLRALANLRDMERPSLILPELEQIARSPDGAGIEEELAKTIEHVRLQRQTTSSRREEINEGDQP
jgi:hypothetical protein